MNDYGVLTAPDTLRIERLLPGPIERVWQYLTDSDKRATWLAVGKRRAAGWWQSGAHFPQFRTLPRTRYSTAQIFPLRGRCAHARQSDRLRATALAELFMECGLRRRIGSELSSWCTTSGSGKTHRHPPPPEQPRRTPQRRRWLAYPSQYPARSPGRQNPGRILEGAYAFGAGVCAALGGINFQ